MASKTDDKFKDDLLRVLAEQARRLVARPRILPSETLRKTLFVRKSTKTNTYVLGSPYYWAYYYHEGRGAMEQTGKSGKKFLVWFQNPKDDPRIAGGYPKTRSQRKRLSKEDFVQGAAMNRRMDPSGETMPYMIITKKAGPMIGRPFFDNGLKNFRAAARRTIRNKFPQFVKERIKIEQALRSWRSQQFRISL